MNTDSTNTNYRVWVKDNLGDLTSETTIIRSGGANDGVSGLSWHIVTTANAFYQDPFYSIEFDIWNDAVGSSKTITVEFVHDSVTALTDKDIWLDTEYLGTASFPLGVLASTPKNILQTGSNWAASSATWNTTGMTNPNKQAMTATFTPQVKGYIQCKLRVAKASYTVFVDPMITVS